MVTEQEILEKLTKGEEVAISENDLFRAVAEVEGVKFFENARAAGYTHEMVAGSFQRYLTKRVRRWLAENRIFWSFHPLYQHLLLMQSPKRFSA